MTDLPDRIFVGHDGIWQSRDDIPGHRREYLRADTLPTESELLQIIKFFTNRASCDQELLANSILNRLKGDDHE